MEQEPQTPRERAEDLIRLLVSDWRPTPQQVLWGIRIAIAFFIVLFILTLVGRPFNITLWQWLELLIVPAVLAIGGPLLTRSAIPAILAAAERQNRATQEAAERRAQDEALQAYLDQMSAMMIPNNDQPSLSDKHPPDSLKTVARARTLTMLPRLAGDGKGRVVQFLHESNLITREVQNEQGEVVQEKVVDLRGGADLRDANLQALYLRGVALDGVNLERADLNHASLIDADLSGSLLSGAALSSADLSGADLSEANLSGADLTHAGGWTEEQLDKALFLDGATMPDGRVLKGPENPNGPTFEEWRKSSSP